MTEAHPLTDKALQKLYALIEGNGIEPGQIELLGTEEKELTLRAEMHLILDVSFKKQRYPGPPRVKKNPSAVVHLGSAQEMAARVDEFRVKLSETSRWINETVEQFKVAPGQGFGMQQADVTLETMAQLFSATEVCETCHGTNSQKCQTCNSTGFVPCEMCHGSGQEVCQHCQGSGNNPASTRQSCHLCHGTGVIEEEQTCYQCHGQGTVPVTTQQRCPVCNGNMRVPCRICFGKRQVGCPTCQGKGSSACQTCGGHGKFTMEERALPTVHCDFKVIGSTELPSGLRRAVDRNGFKMLVRVAHIQMETAQEGKDKTAILPYTVQLPLAEARLRIDGKPMHVTILGERGSIRDIPPFFDPIFEKMLEEIEKKPGSSPLDRAFKFRAMRDLFALMQRGEDVVTGFRRLYPIGFSVSVFERMERLLNRSAQESTFMVRASAAGFSLLLLGIAYYGVMISGVRASLAHAIFPPAAFMLDGLVCGFSFLFIDVALRFAAAAHLRSLSRLNDKVNMDAQRAGSLGFTVGVCAMLLYIGMLWVLKATPGFFG
ncbi:MAG: hypothetical protein HY053_07550 [Proteobacteria bacterium]|nr:hypothetical protein [Pseudomonadota bacterium]